MSNHLGALIRRNIRFSQIPDNKTVAIGSKEAGEIYAQLEKTEPTPAIFLLNQAIELQFQRTLNIQTIPATEAKLRNNPVCIRILKDMVIQHTYMFLV